MEGHLKIVSLKEVELAGARPWKVTSGNYAEYPLIILSRDGKKEIGRVTADRDGNYRVVLPPGDYILDVAGAGTRAEITALAETHSGRDRAKAHECKHHFEPGAGRHQRAQLNFLDAPVFKTKAG